MWLLHFHSNIHDMTGETSTNSLKEITLKVLYSIGDMKTYVHVH